MDTFEHDQGSVIGKDIPYETIEREFCRVKKFTPFAVIEADKIREVSKFMPYAALSVESPRLPGEATMYVTHKHDFRHLWDVFQQRGVKAEEEVLVAYVPKKRRFLSGAWASLHIYVFPKEHLEEMYDQNFRPDSYEAWLTPIAEWEPTNIVGPNQELATSMNRRAFKNALIITVILMVIWALVLEFIPEGWWVLAINVAGVILTSWILLSCAIPFLKAYMPTVLAGMASGTLWFVMFVAIRNVIGLVVGI